MLPPKELSTNCPRCHRPLEVEQQICPDCGADREVELKVAAELNPAIASLRRWLGLVAGFLCTIGFINYAHFGSALPTIDLLLPFAVAAGLLILCALARRIPLPAALIALSLFLFDWGMAARENLAAILTPGLGTALRVMSVAVLVDGVRAGFRARAIRQRAADASPTARVVTRKKPRRQAAP